jgi:hypothetical protein
MKYKFGLIADKEDHEKETKRLIDIRWELFRYFKLFYMTDEGFNLSNINQSSFNIIGLNSSRIVKFLNINDDLKFYKTNVRNEIRKSLKLNYVNEVSLSDLRRSCEDIYNEFNNSKGISLLQGNLEYENFINRIIGNRFFICYDADSHKPVSFCIVLEKRNSIHLSTIKYLTSYAKKNYCNYALIFHLINLYKSSYIYLSNGYKPIDGHSGIQDFLIRKFGFVEVPVQRYIVLHPFIWILYKLKFLEFFKHGKYLK